MAERVDLYRFVEATSGLIWTLTNSDIEHTYNAGSGVETYEPTALGRTEILQKQEISKANLDVTLNIAHSLSIRLLSIIPENQLFLTIFTKDGMDVNVSWKGRLQSVAPGDSTISMSFESIFTSMRRPGIRARYQRSCRHALYGRGCWLDPEDFASIAACSAATDTVLTVASAALQANGFYTGGMLRAPDNSLSYIIKHVGSAITLQRPSLGIRTSIAGGFPFNITLYPGCAHNRPDCITKFDNLLNYGGFDWIPLKNPMGGSSIV